MGEQPGAGVAARDAFHLVHRQELVRLRAIGEEFVSSVVVTGNHENIAANLPAARRFKPIGAAALHELDKLKLVRRQAPAKRGLLVG